MRKSLLALAVLSGIVISTLAPNAQARTVSAREHGCLAALAHWEGGSSKLRYWEMVAEVLSVFNKRKDTNYWHRRDWGGPDICDIVTKVSGSYQYSFVPKHGTRFDCRVNLVEEARLVPRLEIMWVYPFYRFVRSITEYELRRRSCQVVDDVLNGARPPGDIATATTYQHWCSDPKYYDPSCDPRVVSSPQSKCYWALWRKETRDQFPEGARRHIFYVEKDRMELFRDLLENEFPWQCKGTDDPDKKWYSVKYVEEQRKDMWGKVREWNFVPKQNGSPDVGFAATRNQVFAKLKELGGEVRERATRSIKKVKNAVKGRLKKHKEKREKRKKEKTQKKKEYTEKKKRKNAR